MKTLLATAALVVSTIELLSGCATYRPATSLVSRRPVTNMASEKRIDNTGTPAAYRMETGSDSRQATRYHEASEPRIASSSKPSTNTQGRVPTHANATPSPGRSSAQTPPRNTTYQSAPQPHAHGTAEIPPPAVSRCQALIDESWRFYTNMEVGQALQSARNAYWCDPATDPERTAAAIIAGASAYVLGDEASAARWFDAAIQSNPKALPNPKEFPEGVLRIYDQRLRELTTRR